MFVGDSVKECGREKRRRRGPGEESRGERDNGCGGPLSLREDLVEEAEHLGHVELHVFKIQ